MRYETVVSELRLALGSKDPGEELARLVRKLNNQGATKNELVDWLRRLADEGAEQSEEKEDAVNDVIEFVCRYL